MNDIRYKVGNMIAPVTDIYRLLTQNTVLRHRLAIAGLSDNQWREIEMLVALGEDSSSETFDLFNIYAGIRSLLAFAQALISEIKPALRHELAKPQSQISAQNRVAIRMTYSNLDYNARVLVDRLSDLYIALNNNVTKDHEKYDSIRKEFADLTESKAWTLET